MQRRNLLIAATALAAGPVVAQSPPLVVVELFTSQSCSSCPPADALLGEIVRDRADVFALSYHVTYWDRLGWRDSFSLAVATERQRRYAATLPGSIYGVGQVYTPQLVIQGRRDAVGSNRAAVLAAIRAEAAAPHPRPALALTPADGGIAVEVAQGPGTGTLWLVGYDASHTVEVRSGENRGRRLAYSNVVRSLQPGGVWRGTTLRQVAPRPAGERVAVLLQGEDGGIIAAARG